jgi:hypothetical protein
MNDGESSGVVPIDAEVREVLREFSEAPIALASEIVRLRIELDSLRGERPHSEITIQPLEPPSGSPPPAHLEI